MKTNILASYLESKGMRYVEAARRTGVHETTIRRHALGEVRPGLDTLNIYARVLRIPLGKLLQWDVEAPDDAA